MPGNSWIGKWQGSIKRVLRSRFQEPGFGTGALDLEFECQVCLVVSGKFATGFVLLR